MNIYIERQYMDKLSELNDDTLLQQITIGNNEAFEVLYYRYNDKIYSYILRILNFNEQETETIITETFLKMYKYIKGNNKNISNFKSFLYKTAHNLAINFIQKESKQTFIETSNFEFIQNNDYENMKESINQEFKQDIIQELLKRISPKYREIIYLYYFEGNNYEQISKIINSNKNTVATLLSRAKKQLKEISNKYGYSNIL